MFVNLTLQLKIVRAHFSKLCYNELTEIDMNTEN